MATIESLRKACHAGDHRFVARILRNNNNLVNEVDAIGEAFCTNLVGGTWKRTSYNGNYRTRYAGIGYTYDDARDVFISPQPFPSWILNETTTEWEPPGGFPADFGEVPGPVYQWDEDEAVWVEIFRD